MSGGLAALLDDIAALAKLTAASLDDIGAAAGKAGGKSLGVVVDDAAVTPRYVDGFTASRELPMIKKIAIGSIRNKLVFILPAVLLLSQFVPWIITPILMLGGLYLSYEGAEKVWEVISGHSKQADAVPAAAVSPVPEDAMVRSAITTDFILSAEIMIIARTRWPTSRSSPGQSFCHGGLAITALVYGVVAIIVKMDDVGLHSLNGSTRFRSGSGGCSWRMPVVLKVLSTVGIAAMLWVGGHILLVGLDTLGWHWLYDQVHTVEEWIAHAMPVAGSFFAWLVNTLASALVGLLVGAVAVAVRHVLPQQFS